MNVDNDVKVDVLLTDCRQRGRLSTMQATKLESIVARSYRDDADIRLGALSAPRSQIRPGQRDDTESCLSIGMLPGIL